MAISLNQLNRRIARDVSPLIELVRGAGYHYFIFDNRDAGDGIAVHETHSVMVWATKQLSTEQWLEEARAFANGMEIIVNERLAIKAEVREAQTAVQEWRETKVGAQIAKAWAAPTPDAPLGGEHMLCVELHTGGPVPDVIARFWLASHAGRCARALSAAGTPIAMRDMRGDEPRTFWFIDGQTAYAAEAKAAGLPFTPEENI